MSGFKDKYVRNIIKLGNSKAVTFPQEWAEAADLKEKSEVIMYPINDRNIIIATREDEQKRVLRINPVKSGKEWTLALLNQAIISAFKLNVDEIYIKYNQNIKQKLYELLIKLRQEIIAIDFKDIVESNEFYIIFLLDTSKTDLIDVLKDLAMVFKTIIESIIESSKKKGAKIEIANYELIMAEIDRKYSLGTRILITGLSGYHLSKGYRNLPIIRFLGNRVVLLYIRDFINEAFRFLKLPSETVNKYSSLLIKIPNLLQNLIKNFDNINEETVSKFQVFLSELNQELESIEHDEQLAPELQFRNIVKYYLNAFTNFFDIGITRMIQNLIEY
ncbi:MAG: AbrB/MazE/SpoVT family DNA-binding domain-containing protein [Candidatus Lokiarchaeota archaeon]|nr:AbrB/MazE/SpoVT family DNA-binding domain-containing protein [Candidatus Lokiarchaeota archaeon]